MVAEAAFPTWALSAAGLLGFFVLAVGVLLVLLIVSMTKRRSAVDRPLKMILAIVGLFGFYGNNLLADDGPIPSNDSAIEGAVESTDSDSESDSDSETDTAAEDTAAEDTAAEDAAAEDAAGAEEIAPDDTDTSDDTNTAVIEDPTDTANPAEETIDSEATDAEPASDPSTYKKVTQLSVPLDTSPNIIIPPGRPNWVDSAKMDIDIPWKAIMSDPCRTTNEAEASLKTEVYKFAAHYLDEHVLQEAGASDRLGYSEDSQVMRDLLFSPETYSETVFFKDIGDRKMIHAKVHITPVFSSTVRHDWHNYVATLREAQVTRRILFTTVGSFGVLLFIGVVFSYLKFDTATRGYYTGRLQFGAVVAILAVVAAGVLIAKWVNGI